jgi:hypothetical protein
MCFLQEGGEWKTCFLHGGSMLHVLGKQGGLVHAVQQCMGEGICVKHTGMRHTAQCATVGQHIECGN